MFKHFVRLLFENSFNFLYLNIYILQLISSEHSSQSTMSDMTTEMLSQLQFYCLFCETLVSSFTVNPTAAIPALKHQQNHTKEVLIAR